MEKLEKKLWVKVYVAALESGLTNPAYKADEAVKQFKLSFN